MSMKRLVYGIAGTMIVFAGAGVIVAAQPKSGSSAPAYNTTSATTGGHMAKALAPSDQPSAQRNQAIKIIIASNASPKAIKPASKPSETPTPTPAAEQKPAATNGASSGSNTRSKSNAQKSNPSNNKSSSNSNVPSLEFVDRVFVTVNKERAARSLGSVQRIEQIDTSSRTQSAYNAQINKLSHDGGLDRLKQLYSCRTSGEILELVPISYNEQQATDVWINSPPHNKIMFSGDYDKAGIGLTQKGDQYYIAMQFCR
ncbi:MAG: CAP domain-containing protein [Candidatus Saccharibacteria bacterium]|nr:CAP domain-containing protein [Candidatus Saccharibacteria bacterium]